ncbi:MAG TPA: DEAD/DEAH box helicase [Candidatus Methylacidiphilales bacterium]|nr:DEAD/DEAH box helicase [Candidatus Methylacidiphilales bacterium]
MTSPTTTPSHSPALAAPVTITFASLALIEPLQRALREKDYTEPSPIQAGAIPHLLQGRDLIGIAQTGTGKTAAFALPILQKLATHPAPPVSKRPRALILAPTRELAAQIGQSFQHYGRHLRLRHTVIFGGVGQNPQVQALARGVDILIATPGRLQDLQQQKHVFLDKVEVFVLDEADRMLDMGFVHDVKRIITTLPPRRQSLLFSATMPPVIEELAASLVHHAARVEVTPVATTAERIEQHVAFVDRGNKVKLLAHLVGQHADGLVITFVRMKHMANRLVEQLSKHEIRAEAIHGNKSQSARQRALENFRTGHSRVLVATDIAARGIDVKGISLVVNYDLPEEPESYVHRIGRTARAGRTGIAVAFCDDGERNLLRQIERLIRQPIPVLKGHPYEASEPKNREARGPLGNGIDRPHRPNGPCRGGFRSRFHR